VRVRVCAACACVPVPEFHVLSCSSATYSSSNKLALNKKREVGGEGVEEFSDCLSLEPS